MQMGRPVVVVQGSLIQLSLIPNEDFDEEDLEDFPDIAEVEKPLFMLVCANSASAEVLSREIMQCAMRATSPQMLRELLTRFLN